MSLCVKKKENDFENLELFIKMPVKFDKKLFVLEIEFDLFE
jgi:hypothetical protein